jgi:hypothetical protein
MLAGGLFALGLGTCNVVQARLSTASNSHGMMNHAAVAKLHEAAHHLEHAKHDYDGHRLKALHEVKVALHALGTGSKEHGKKSTFTTTTRSGAKLNESQSQSDHLLRQALGELHTAAKDLKGSGERHHHHQKAEHAIHKAIHELHVALKIR